MRRLLILIFLTCCCFCLSVHDGAGNAGRGEGDWLSELTVSIDVSSFYLL